MIGESEGRIMIEKDARLCNACKVTVHAQHVFCPLCGRKISGNTSESHTAYPIYNYPKGKRGFTLKNILLFTTIVACAISIYVNLFTLDAYVEFWSGTVTCSIVAFWLLITTLYSDRMSLGKKTLMVYVILSILLFIIDLFSGFNKWSSTYVIPFMTGALTLFYTGLALSGKKRYRDYLGYLIANFFISFIPFILFLFGFSTRIWTSALSVFCSLLTSVALFIFSDERFKSEIKKRFHF